MRSPAGWSPSIRRGSVSGRRSRASPARRARPRPRRGSSRPLPARVLHREVEQHAHVPHHLRLRGGEKADEGACYLAVVLLELLDDLEQVSLAGCPALPAGRPAFRARLGDTRVRHSSMIIVTVMTVNSLRKSCKSTERKGFDRRLDAATIASGEALPPSRDLRHVRR